jgi:LruC domain-containing protein/choice-of-anchor A domain-containing protein
MKSRTLSRAIAAPPVCLAMAVLMLALCAAAHAQTCVGLGQAAPYNVFVLGDMSGMDSDTEGSIAVGGNLSLYNYSIGALLPQSPKPQALTVRGSVNFINGAIWGNATVGEDFVTYQAGFANGSLAPAGTPLPVDFASAADELNSLSTSLAALPQTGTLDDYYSNITMTGTDPSLNVFTLNTDWIGRLVIDAPEGSVVLINARGNNYWLANFGVSFVRPITLIYNFPDSTWLGFDAIDPRGTILAPRAQLYFANGAIDGQVIVGSWPQGQYWYIAQSNLAPFTCIPMARKPYCELSNSAVPEPACAGVVSVPAAGEQGTLFFEDLWPTNGDLDFNDQVVSFNQQMVVNVNGQVTSMLATFNLLAVGATIHNGLYFHLPLPFNSASSIILSDSSGAQTRISPMPGEHELVLKLTDDTFKLFAGATAYVNTEASNPTHRGLALSVLVNFAAPVSLDTSTAPYDVYIARTDVPGHQIHLPQYPGTDTMDTTLFGKFDDRSVRGGVHFINEHGLPFALHIPTNVPWPQERVRVDRLFPDLSEFARTGGTSDEAWYKTNLHTEYEFTQGAGNTLPPLPILTW